jgi:subfamily B ATP-binding cassette protein MsbA
MIKAYVSPNLTRLMVIVVLAVICAFFEAVSLGTLVPFIQLLEDQANPGGTLWGVLQGIFQTIRIPLNLATLLILLTALFLVGQVILYVKKRMEVDLRVSFVARLKKRLFSEIVNADIRYHNSQKAGNIISTIVIEVDNAGYGLFAALELLTDAFFIFVYGIMLLYISIEMTIFVLLIAFASLLLLNFTNRKSTFYGRKHIFWNTIQNEFLSERFNLMRLVKTSSTEPVEAGIFSKIADDYAEVHEKYGLTGVQIEILFQSIIFVLAVVVLFVSLNFLKISLPMLILFLFILVRITAPLRDFSSRRHELGRLIPSFTKVDQILKGALEGQQIASGKRIFEGFRDGITFDGVSYSYGPDNAALSDVSIRIPKNEMLALVGPSGGGKSTFVDLLIRMLDPDRGVIRIDGINLREYDIRSYHAKLGVVSQDIFLFNDTILNNIAYGSGDISLERAMAAAKMANAHDFIMELPEDYRTILLEKGVSLSGGQRQRIALARALYKNPEMLILDEATSSLDSESEKVIQNSIKSIKNRYTIITIAHRLSTIEGADRIVVIDKGRIVEMGSPQELLGRESAYARFYSAQFGPNNHGD